MFFLPSGRFTSGGELNDIPAAAHLSHFLNFQLEMFKQQHKNTHLAPVPMVCNTHSRNSSNDFLQQSIR
jgi:hypothetical protein